MELFLVLVGPGVLLFLLELVVLRLTKSRGRPLRQLTLLALLVPVALALQCAWEGGWFWQLGVALYGLMAAGMLLGWALAWMGRPTPKRQEEDSENFGL